jgi:tetratricopeptide (TPR) repeat protein
MNVGDLIADRFELERVADRGGMAVVWRARDRRSGAPTAVKFLRDRMVDSEFERLAREAQVLAGIVHPGVVRYVAHGATPGGIPFLAMEWLEGETLARRLARGPIGVGETLRVLRAVGDALASVHRRGIVHRDLKPQNLLAVGGDLSRLTLIDFGIARWDEKLYAVTRAGIVVGTMGYMAPEQARGERDLDARVDIFALGCVAYECIVGRPPFAAFSSVAMLGCLALETAPRVSEASPDIPDELDDLIAGMLARDPEQRVADGSALSARLAAFDAASPRGALPARTETLTSRELRLFSVVLIARDARLTPRSAEWAVVSAIAASHLGQLDALLDGTAFLSIASVGVATDQAAKAARCALQVQRSIPSASIALATVRAVAADRGLAGEAIDLALRSLLGSRSKGAGASRLIALDEVTAGLLDSRFNVLRDDDGCSLDDGCEPPAPARTLLGRTTPFVGRERELRTLRATWDECVGESVARAVLLRGPPGIGKSRLRHEWMESMGRLVGDGALLMSGESDPMRAGSSLGLLGQSLRREFGIVDGESAALRQARVRARVGRSTTEREVEHVACFLGELMETSFPDDTDTQLRAARRDSRLMADQVRRAWLQWLHAEARARPIMIVFDDVQWGDRTSLDLVEAALRDLRDQPLMVVAFARPEVDAAFPALWSPLPLQLSLTELSHRSTERLVRELLPAVADDQIDRAIARGAGNPFVLEEIIRAMAAGRDASLPDGADAIAHARLEALDAADRRILRAASVFGRRFRADGVAALIGDDPSLGDRIDTLVRNELLLRKTDPAAPDPAEFSFRHDLLRGAAYSSLIDEDRALAHRLALAWLDRSGETDQLVLAQHCERGGDTARLPGLWLRASERALDASDLAASIDYADRGLHAGAAGETLGALRGVQAIAHSWRGEIDLVAARGSEAVAALPRGTARWYRAAGFLASAWIQRGEPQGMEPLMEALDATPSDDDAVRARIAAIAQIAQHCLMTGRTTHVDQLLAWLAADGVAQVATTSPMVAALLHEVRASRHTIDGDPLASAKEKASARRCREEAGDRRGACVAAVNEGFSWSELGDHARAEALLREGIEIADRLGLGITASYARMCLGKTLLACGDTAQARAVLARAIEQARERGRPRTDGLARAVLAEAMARDGELDAAEAEATAALARVESLPSPRCFALATRAAIRLQAGRASEAMADAREAMAVLGAIGGIDMGEARVRRVYAEALGAAGDPEGAAAALRDARDRLIERADRLGEPEWRETFLEGDADNARTMEMARELLE